MMGGWPNAVPHVFRKARVKRAPCNRVEAFVGSYLLCLALNSTDVITSMSRP